MYIKYLLNHMCMAPCRLTEPRTFVLRPGLVIPSPCLAIDRRGQPSDLKINPLRFNVQLLALNF